MAVNNTHEERQLMKLIEEMPVSAEMKQDLTSRIRAGGLNEELWEEIHTRLAEPTEDNFPNRGRIILQLNGIVHRWRLGTQLQSPKHRK